MASNFVPNTYVIQVVLTGDQPLVYLLLGDPNKLNSKTKALSVDVGDRVAWTVPVQLSGGRLYPGFKVKFTDDKFFGTPSVSVPMSRNGLASEFLQVRSISGATSFSLEVDGFGCVFDPEIQSGGGGGPEIICDEVARLLAQPPNYVITFDTTVKPATITYSVNGVNSGDPSPMKVNCGETVKFVVLTAGTPSNFTIQFAANPAHGQQNPFSNNLTLTADPKTPDTIGPELVNDRSSNDVNALFQFTASVCVDGVPVQSDPNKIYSIQLLTNCS